MKKSQGMPVSILVIGALGLLVLGILGAGFLLGWGNIGSGIGSLFAGATGQHDIESVRVRCQTACSQMNGVLSEPCDAFNFNYCKKEFETDDGIVRCYDVIPCSLSLVSGVKRTIDSNECNCNGGCFTDSNSCVSVGCSWDGSSCS